MAQNQDNNLAMQLSGMAHASLADCIARFASYSLGVDDIHNGGGDMTIHIFGVISLFLERDKSLMDKWNKMLAGMSATPVRNNSCIDLCLERVAEEGIVLESLLVAFKALHRPRLLLRSTLHGAKFASKALKVNSTVQMLSIDGTNCTPFKSGKNAAALVQAAINHPSLVVLSIEHCDIGRKRPILEAILPSLLHHIEDIRLDDVNIGSYGVTLIADCLAQNPFVKNLSLSCNKLVDADASKLASSLKTNTTLRNLGVDDNQFTDTGMRALYRSIHGEGTMNDIHDSNHFCFVDVLGAINHYENPRENRIMKLIKMLSSGKGFLLAKAVPMEVIPQLLTLAQGGGFVPDDDTLFNPLQNLFRYIREFNTNLFDINTTALPGTKSFDRIQYDAIKSLKDVKV